MNKKLQVFVSSTYTDLIEERQAAVQAILDAGHIPAGMELFKAGKSQMNTIHNWIDESDVYMLILGGRYGSVEEESGLSYTELEYNYALSKNMPIFTIILEYSFLYAKASSKDKDTIYEKDNIKKYNHFKRTVKTNTVKFVNNTDEIVTAIHLQLNSILNDSDYLLSGPPKKILNQKEVCHEDHPFKQPMFVTNDTTVMPIPKHNQYSIFVVMPFSETWSDETYDIIKEVCNNLDVKLNRADEILGSQSIYNDIITNIIESDIIIVDITVKNANVFYELGYAHALKKNVILIRQPHNNVPFDIAQFRYIEYELSFKKAKEFQRRLTDTINNYKNKIYQ